MKITDAQVRECAAAGMTLAQAARHLKVTHRAVRYRGDRIGVEFASARVYSEDLSPRQRVAYLALMELKRDRVSALRAIGRPDLILSIGTRA
jgi:hypothetical protein